MNKAPTIKDYISDFPVSTQKKLKQLQSLIKKTVPKAEETISYGMPAYKLNGPIVYFAAYKNHIGFYPTPAPILAFKQELKKYKTSKGAVQFPLDEDLPVSLIGKMLRFKVKANLSKIRSKK